MIPSKLWLLLQSLLCSLLGRHDPHPRSTWRHVSCSLHHSTSLLQTSSSSSRRPRVTTTVHWICRRTFMPARLVRVRGGASLHHCWVSLIEGLRSFPTVSFPFRPCLCVSLRLVSGGAAGENRSILHRQVIRVRSLRRNPPAGDARDGVGSRS